MEPASPTRQPPPGLVVAGAGLAVLVALSSTTLSTSRIVIWPWVMAVDLWWCLVIALALIGAWRHREGLPLLTTLGLVVLAAAAGFSAHASLLPGVSVPSALPVIGACALPFALLPLLAKHPAQTRRGLGLASLTIVAASLHHWFWRDLQPALEGGASLASALSIRNEHPFGHSNYTAAFALLALGWLLACLAAASCRRERVLWSVGTAAAVITLFSTSSRAGVGAVACGVAVFLVLNRRRLARLPRRTRLAAGTTLAALVVLGVLGNARLRDLMLHGRWNAVSSESNEQRLGMAQAAVRLGLDSPWFGTGPGMVPQLFPSVRLHVAGNFDNVIQVHSSPLQAWATLGAAGVAGSLLLLVGLGQSCRVSPGGSEPGAGRSHLASALAAYAAFTLFDHSLDVPVIALFAAAQLAALGAGDTGASRAFVGRHAAVLIALFGLTLLPGVVSDLRVRRLHSDALGRLELNDPAGYAARLTEAGRILPDVTYPAHLLACELATGHPFSIAPPPDGAKAAIELLRRTLDRNNALEYAWYNLGWLHLESEPGTAEMEFIQSARLAPHRLGVYHGMALARAALGRDYKAVAAFATERLNDPRQAFAPLFRDPTMQEVEKKIRALAVRRLNELRTAGLVPAEAADRVLAFWEKTDPATISAGPAFRRVRSGYGILAGFPEGPPPVDVNVVTSTTLPPDVDAALPRPGWIPARELFRFSFNQLDRSDMPP